MLRFSEFSDEMEARVGGGGAAEEGWEVEAGREEESSTPKRVPRA
jgi:hypothetical protein